MKPMDNKEIRLMNEMVGDVNKQPLTEADSKWAEQVRRELADELEMELDDVRIVSSSANQATIEGSGSNNGESEWEVYKNEKDARADAIERATDSLQDGADLSDIINMGGSGHKGWIKKFMFVSATDIRLLSNEEADNYVDGIKEEDDGERVTDEAGMGRQFEKIKEKIDDIMDVSGELDKSSKKKLAKLIKDKEKVIDKAVDKLKDSYSKDLKKRLEKDPIEWAEELGYDDLSKVSWLNVEWEKAGEYVVDTDGIAHTLDGYDGEEIDLKSGTAYGTN